jgi:hypothetical protein
LIAYRQERYRGRKLTERFAVHISRPVSATASCFQLDYRHLNKRDEDSASVIRGPRRRVHRNGNQFRSAGSSSLLPFC